MKHLLRNLLCASIITLTSICNCSAQINLVNDGSFEDTTIGWYNEVYGEGMLNDWHTFGKVKLFVNNFAYFSSKFPAIVDTASKLPYNNYFRTYALSGHAAMDILLYANPVPAFPVGTPNMRSIVQNTLHDTLLAGQVSCITGYVKAPTRVGYVNTNGLQFYFDNGQLDTVYNIHKDSSGIYPFVQPQYKIPFLISDTANWVKFQGSFTANGTETHMTVGNFMTDNATTTALAAGNVGGYAGTCRCQDVLIDNISVIPIDLHNWLPDAYTTLGADSVWVGLDPFDYQDGKWYDKNMNYITTGPGFWYKPIEASGAQFIQEVEVCGVLKYDTCTVYAYPAAVSSTAPVRHALQIYPNPASQTITVSNITGSTVQLVNVLGETVYHQNSINKTVSIDVANLPRGVYFVKAGKQVGRVLLQ
jgi:hypothetical protein